MKRPVDYFDRKFVKEYLENIGIEVKETSDYLFHSTECIINGFPDNNDFYLPNQNCYVFVIKDIEGVEFELCENLYPKNASFLFFDLNFKIKFYDAESLGWNIDKNGAKRFCVKADEIIIIRCSHCGKVTLAESIGAWYCRNCHYQEGDSDVEGTLLDYNRSIKTTNCVIPQKDYYTEYILSDEWKQKRQEIFKQKGRKCSICGVESGIIDCHHLNYDNLGHEEDNNFEDVIPLCRGCHQKLHEFLKNNDSVIQSLKLELQRLKDSFAAKYRYAIVDIIYNHTKDLFDNEALVKPYSDSLYGKVKCNNNIRSHFSSDMLYKKLKKEGRL